MINFISNFKTTIIGSLNKDTTPFTSYAPFIYEDNKFYIYISAIATHTQNIQRNKDTSLFFIRLLLKQQAFNIDFHLVS